MQDFHNLVVWQKSHAWVLEVYKITKRFPDDERFGLISQLRRSAACEPRRSVRSGWQIGI
jgi:four helix bundle protein